MSELTRVEALDKANEIVDEWTNAKRNERGYVHDKWQPVDPNVRATAVLRLAEFLLVPAQTAHPEGHGTNLIAPAGPGAPSHRHRASCDDTIGNHMCGYP